MSPRGVAIPDLRVRLFAAAERVVARDGAGALTSRAVTEEAGCGKGVLHTHFAGLDTFVAELVLDRFASTARLMQALPARAGQDTVAHNLVRAARALMDSLDPGIVALALTLPGASSHTRRAWQEGAPGFAVIEEAVRAYLVAEQELGRVAADTDTAAAALALVGTLHHLLMTRTPGSPAPEDQMERLVALLLHS
ncbi:TetR family transcriptional regulator [Streptomyces litmocidini]|uniref:TetR/AcrR family transcriptional regulator n=1 Tax=Streptomyces litmocidini TaxID=67318 RepID=UPI00167CA822|nr:TetR/AcrR family transcriptional regulator [Streptomyces litmocidini]GGU80224.1 TetR family transcriptional regulator [Streptomyces litmocidini]